MLPWLLLAFTTVAWPAAVGGPLSRVVTALSLLTVLGALLHAAAASERVFILARLLVGLGCAGSFMASVVLCVRWYPGKSFATMLSRVFALSNIGYLLAGSPDDTLKALDLDETALRAVATAARERVFDEHTSEHRARTLLEAFDHANASAPETIAMSA